MLLLAQKCYVILSEFGAVDLNGRNRNREKEQATASCLRNNPSLDPSSQYRLKTGALNLALVHL